MKHLLLLTIGLISCQSQQDKDREKMQSLLDQKHTLEFRYRHIDSLNKVMEPEMILKAEEMYPISDKMSIDSQAFMEGKQNRALVDMQHMQLMPIEDSIKAVDLQIKELKLLMGK